MVADARECDEAFKRMPTVFATPPDMQREIDLGSGTGCQRQVQMFWGSLERSAESARIRRSIPTGFAGRMKACGQQEFATPFPENDIGLARCHRFPKMTSGLPDVIIDGDPSRASPTWMREKGHASRFQTEFKVLLTDDPVVRRQ